MHYIMFTHPGLISLWSRLWVDGTSMGSGQLIINHQGNYSLQVFYIYSIPTWLQWIFTTVDDNYGVDEEDLVSEGDVEGVEVPPGRFTLNSEHFHELQLSIDPLARSGNYGVDIYDDTLQFILHCVRDPNDYPHVS